MTAAAAESPRHAALLLHAMEPADRAWLLAALPAGDRSRVEVLLQDLQELGIPRDTELLRPLLGSAPVPAPSAGERLRQLPALSARRLALALEAEPPRLAERLRAMADGSAPADPASVRDTACCVAALDFLARQPQATHPPPRGAARWRALLAAGRWRGVRA